MLDGACSAKQQHGISHGKIFGHSIPWPSLAQDVCFPMNLSIYRPVSWTHLERPGFCRPLARPKVATVSLLLGTICKQCRLVTLGRKPTPNIVARCQPHGVGIEHTTPSRNCPKCLRPRRVCLCETLPEVIETSTQIVLFTHPKELKRSLCTGPLLELCLKRVIKFVGKEFPDPEENPSLHEQLCQGGRQCFLLYPGPEALDVSEIAVTVSPVTLILIDARWQQARIMLNRSSWLQELPRLSLPHQQSGYIWRQQPAAGCISTLEAVSEALKVLEGNEGARIKSLLLRPFEKMVQLQCQFTPNATDKNADLGLPLGVAKENANPLWNRSRRRKRRRNSAQNLDLV